MTSHEQTSENLQRRREWRLFLFITVLLFPILSVLVVGAYGFVVWAYQLLTG